MKYINLLKESGFDEPEDTCINVRTKNFDYTLAFISFETEKQLGILETTDSGHEKLKIINKEFIEVVEIVYQDDIEMNYTEEPVNKMYG